MCGNRISFVLAVVVAVALAMPLAAWSNTGKKSTASATIVLLRDAAIGGKQVKAGTYDVKANESTITLSREGKVVAEAPITWKDEQSKSPYSSIVVASGTLKEAHFSGKARYADVSGASSASIGQQ
jgi:Rieske Fe-S protein